MIPWKLIFFLVILAVFVLFAGFNVANTSDISFGFTKVQNVPIFLSLFISFLLGAFVMLPFAIAQKRKAKKKREEKQNRKKNKKNDRKPSVDPVLTDIKKDESQSIDT